MNRILLFVALLVTVYGCTNSTENNLLFEKSKTHKTIKFDLTQEPVNIHETGLIRDMDIIHLDCEEVFDEINKIIPIY
ncbi:MAG: hypothetical protein LBD59_10955 [Prevotellaceae bacterium]|jgi:hypothetical protein|nr:hypothetical protein [Prevotellaceae bacterium]